MNFFVRLPANLSDTLVLYPSSHGHLYKTRITDRLQGGARKSFRRLLTDCIKYEKYVPTDLCNYL